MDSHTWRGYVDRFHADAPGVTERLLRATRDDDGRDPYAWTAQAVPDAGVIVDVACGSAPLAAHVAHDRYLGIDGSPAELRVAARRVPRVVRGDAAALPVADEAADVVCCLMGLMITQPLDSVQRELGRVLRPGGRMVALLSAGLPRGLADTARWTAIAAALGLPGLRWPNPQVLRPAATWIDPALIVGSDDVEVFTYRIDDDTDARRLITALYLPGVPDARIGRAVRMAASWIGGTIGLPLRRVVAHRAGAARATG